MKKLLFIIAILSFSITNAQIVTIPDANFKQALLDNTYVNTNGDTEIQVSEAVATYMLYDLYNKNIADLTGIEAFTNLTQLECSSNPLTTLDISNNTNLTSLICYNNSLTTLDISSNTNLTELDCGSNLLTTLDISNNTNLTRLDCRKNSLSTLDVSNNTNLTNLSCGENIFNSLDLSNNTNLTDLNIDRSDFTTIDLSSNTNLERFGCFRNNFTTLDMSNNTNLVYLSCSQNNIANLDVSNNIALTSLLCTSNILTTIDVSSNIALTRLDIGDNSLTSLDVTNNVLITYLEYYGNNVSTIDLSNNTLLDGMICSNNNIVNIDLSNNINLETLYASGNNFVTLDLSNNPLLDTYQLGNNPDLATLNLKNGNNENYYQFSNFTELPSLSIVGVDELGSDFAIFIANQVGHPITFTDQINFQPAQSNLISGMATIDMDNNGCDVNDLSLNNVLITADNGVNTYSTVVQSDGSYSLYTEEGDYTISILTNLPNYYVTTPSSQTHTFTGFDNTFTADFCTVPDQTINDVSISLIPTSEARPGFDATYQLIYKNIGTTSLDGSITLDFDDTKLQFLNASETVTTQTATSLTFNYTALDVFETRTINIEFNIFPPPTVNIDEFLDFIATINPISSDNTPDDNVFNLNQIIIGSFDPNDITCLEGDGILIEEVPNYLHYVIRFQNKGTASAINIVVENTLDANLDWGTFQLESASHDNRIEIKNGNEIEFIFEGIELIDEEHDEPNSHGFIAYKIKPLSTLILGDAVSNQADIFFDFNEAVVTNLATTTVVEPSSANINNNEFLYFSIYPTPTTDVLQISTKTEISTITIYNKLGQLIKGNQKQNNINITNLPPDIYFVKIKDINGKIGIQKIIKQ